MALLLYFTESMIYLMHNLPFAACNLTGFVLKCICGRRGFFRWRPLAVQIMHGFFFLQKLPAKIQPAMQNPAARPSPAKKIR